MTGNALGPIQCIMVSFLEILFELARRLNPPHLIVQSVASRSATGIVTERNARLGHCADPRVHCSRFVSLLIALLCWSEVSGEPFVDMGTTTLLGGINQPFVQYLIHGDGTRSFGPPDSLNTALLDTGSSSILVVGQAATALHSTTGDFDQGEYLEQGIGGFVPYRVSAPYEVEIETATSVISFDDTRILSDPGGSFGVGVQLDAIVGMPAMTNRVTTMQMAGRAALSGISFDDLLGDLGGIGLGFGGSGLLDPGGLIDLGGLGDLGGLDLFGLDDIIFGGLDQFGLEDDLFGLEDLLGGLHLDLSQLSTVQVSFSDQLPISNDHRYGIPVGPLDFSVADNPELPTVAPLPVLRATHYANRRAKTSDNIILDTGAQISFISPGIAKDLRLNLTSPESTISVSGVGQPIHAPVFTLDHVGITSDEGVEMNWRDVQVAVLDIDPSVDGVIGSDLLNSGNAELDLAGLLLGGTPTVGESIIDAVHFDFRRFTTDNGPATSAVYLDLHEGADTVQDGPTRLQPGDANIDLRFDQLDIVQVVRRAKYRSGQPATWGEGDWDGAPGGNQEYTPVGNHRFDQQDVVAALASGNYLSGSYAIQRGDENSQTVSITVQYDARTGDVRIEPTQGVQLTSISLESESGIFRRRNSDELGGVFDSLDEHTLFKATLGGHFGAIELSALALPNLSGDFLDDDLRISGTSVDGESVKAAQLIYRPVPEPCSLRTAFCAILLFAVRYSGNAISKRGRGHWRP